MAFLEQISFPYFLIQVIFYTIPIGLGLLIFQGWRWTTDYGSKMFGWIIVVMGIVGLLAFLWFVRMWIDFQNSSL